MRQESRDFRLAHIAGMTLIVKQDEPSYPPDVGPFGTVTVVLGPNPIPHNIKQSNVPPRRAPAPTAAAPALVNMLSCTCLRCHRPLQ